MVPGQTLRIRASRYYAAADGSLAMNVDFDRADCNDGADNDGDGLFDLLDPGCSGAADAEETAPSRICDNGLDDDGDGRVDYRVDGSGDLGCWDGSSTSETTQCQDGLDNDGQPGIDFDGGASLDLDSNGFVDVEFNPATPPVGAADPECTRAFRNKEASGCGLGFEIALLAPLLGRLERKRRARRPGA
jgi:hypothetical protein